MLGMTPPVNNFTPNPLGNREPIFIEMAELEAFRLVDLEDLSQEEAGQKMGVSRGTIWRLVQSARRKTAQALSEGRPLSISPFTSERSISQKNENEKANSGEQSQ
jgi:predicted DNA-binding protein (UPF0251 family)